MDLAVNTYVHGACMHAWHDAGVLKKKFILNLINMGIVLYYSIILFLYASYDNESVIHNAWAVHSI